MKKLIIIKYAELSTKKGNINYFIKTLKNNIIQRLRDFNVEIISDKARMFIIPNKDNYDEIVGIVKNIFGIQKIVIGYELEDNELDSIKDNVLNLIKDIEFKTFKVETQRSNKDYPMTSMEISKTLGAHILKNIKDIKVDVHNPKLLINIEIRHHHAYIYFEEMMGIKGLPVGVSGKGLLMLSGGIDSPVAGYLALKRGVSLEAVYFESPPHTSENAKNKVIKLRDTLVEYGNEIKLHVINLTDIQESIYKNIPHEYLITILRRMMYRISFMIALRNKCQIIINGESIGQVASQTLTSMKVIESVVTLPIIRPLATFDKSEIIDIAKKINTYETSILPYEDCCTIFVPEHPVINPDLDKCLEYEKLIPYEELINKCLKESTLIKVTKNQFKDML